MSSDDEKQSEQSALDTLFWRDEILQVLFWLQGENLAETVQAEDLQPFLQGDRNTIQHYLEKFAEEGYLDRHAAGADGQTSTTHYALSDQGEEEGSRRFAEAFDGMQKQGHGECSPDCDCEGFGHSPSCPSHAHHQH